MKLADFLQSQARKAGVTVELSNVPDFDLPEDFTRGVDNSLISIVEAKNNHPEIKNHYQKQSLDTVDKVLQKVLEANPELLEDEELKTERSTYKRVEMITGKIADLSAKKAGADTSKQKNDIQKQIDDLHAQLRQANEKLAAEKQNFDSSLKEYKKKTTLSQLLSKHKTIHDHLDGDTRVAILETLLNKELQDNQAKFDFDEAGRLVLLKSDGTNLFGENHQQILPEQFIEKTFAKHKQLQVSNGQQAQPSQQSQPRVVDADNKNASLIAKNKAALEAYTKGSQINADIMR